jgi:Gpi18-like mannosyltransferase
MIVLVMSLGSQVQFVQKVESNTLWETRLTYQPANTLPELERLAMIGDAWWYRWIAVEGYQQRHFDERPANWAFFPLFPLTVRLVRITGNFAYDGAIVSNIALFLAMILLRNVAIGFGLDEDAANRAVFYLAFFPPSYFLSLPLSEGLFLALSLACVSAAQHERWWLAGVAGGLAALTRVTGLLLLPTLLVYVVERRQRLRLSLLWLAAIPAAVACFMFYLYRITGNPLAFSDVQANWGRHPGWFYRPLLAYLGNPLEMGVRWNMVIFNLAMVILLLIVALVLLLRREGSQATYVLGCTLLPLSSGSLQSFARYAIVVFPLFLVLAMLGRRPLVNHAILATSSFLLGVFVALFILRVDFALA